VGDNSFAPAPVRSGYGTFVVQNIAVPAKVVRVFHYPLNPAGTDGDTRDLLAIPGISEESIRASLLKGELQHKLRSGELTIIASDVDLLEFNNNQAAFLQSYGVATGIQIGISQQAFVWSQDIHLVGLVNGVNNIFTIPSGVFIQSGQYKIVVYLNGVKQNYTDDYIIAASTSAGYDTVVFTVPPESSVLPVDVITADYWQVQ
jgi:hypothetical protein